MTAYIVRRCLYAIPILVGINVIVFALFFFVNTPDDMAARHLGEKRVTPDQIDRFKREHNLDLPYFYNSGWRRIGSVSASAKSNERTFRTPGAGRYALVAEAPANVKEAAKAGVRRVRVACSAPGRLSALPAGFSADGVLELRFDREVLEEGELPEKDRSRRYEFEIAPGDGPGPEVTVGFDLEDKGLRHRVVLEFKDSYGLAERFTQTLFYQHSFRMLFFRYGKSMKGKPIGRQVLKRMLPSLTITVPSFVLGIVVTIFFAMMLAFLRGTYVDYWGVILCVVTMSVSWMFYILGAQLLLGKHMRLFPISGYDYGVASWKFIAMPILTSVIAGLGGGARFYRTVFLEEIGKDYVRTARAKGLQERTVLFVHVLKNAMIPILTTVIVSLPFLISGGLVMESFFAIPGLGSFTIDGIRAQDFIVVQSMVSLGSFMYVVALLLTDISYTLVDPRVRLE